MQSNAKNKYKIHYFKREDYKFLCAAKSYFLEKKFCGMIKMYIVEIKIIVTKAVKASSQKR